MAQDGPATENAPVTAAPTILPNISFARLQVIIAGLWLSLFIAALDGTIISTSLIKISSDFSALNQAAWLVTAYLLTYNSFLMIAAKFTDVLGLKTILLGCNAFFLIFSMACGGAQSMVQLIVFRALQGIGGSGCYSLVFVAIMKIITPEKMGFYSGVISSVFAFANLLGPLLGGAITDHTTWRWIFWLNGPVVGIAMALLFFSLPGLDDGKSNRERLRGFDVLGGILSICWPIPLLFALQEGGSDYAWNSSIIIGTLTAGIVALILFGSWETWVTYRTTMDAIFPIRFIRNPAMALLLLSQFLIGMPFYTAIIQLPQRFQAVNHTSAERAGILLLPVTLMTPVGAMFTGLVMGKRIAAEYVLLLAGALVCIGLGLLSSLPVHAGIAPATYGYEIITGLGLGLSSPPFFFLLYSSVEERDASVGTAALNMWRTLGGCVAVAICTALHNSVLQDRLPAFLSPAQIILVQDSSTYRTKLPQELQDRIGAVFGQSYNRQFRAMTAFAGLNVVVVIILMVVRRRMGIFGAIPVRKEENEFMKKQKTSEDEEGARENNDIPLQQVPSADASYRARTADSDNISAMHERIEGVAARHTLKS